MPKIYVIAIDHLPIHISDDNVYRVWLKLPEELRHRISNPQNEDKVREQIGREITDRRMCGQLICEIIGSFIFQKGEGHCRPVHYYWREFVDLCGLTDDDMFTVWRTMRREGFPEGNVCWH